MEERQSHLGLRGDKLTTLYDKETKAAAELLRLRMHNANRTVETLKLKSAAAKSEQPAKRPTVFREVKNSLNAPSTAANSAKLAKRDKFKNCCEASVLEY